MKSQKTYAVVRRKSWMMVFTGLVIICAMVGTACFQYYSQLQKTVRKEGGEYLQEISKLLASDANRIINDNFSMLGTIDMVLRDSNISTFAQLKKLSLSQQEYWQYDRIYLVDKKGIAHDSSGHSIMLGNETFLQDVILHSQPSMSSTVVVDGKDSVIFARPIQPLTLDGTEICAVATSYNLSTFDQILSMTAFGGKAYAHIIKPDGSVVIRSSSQNAEQSGYNILNSIAQGEPKNKTSMAKLKADVGNGHGGICEYSFNGVRKYMAYTPLVSREWVLLTIVPVSVVSEKSEFLLGITVLLCGAITLTFGVLLAFLVASFYRNRRSLENIAFVDPVTGGNTIQKFYEDVATQQEKWAGKKPYCIVYMNIEKFKLLNEQFGKKSCDELLRAINHSISEDLEGDECVGRQFADNFCLLLRYEDTEKLAERFNLWKNECALYLEKREQVWIPHTCEFGIFVIDNGDIPLAQMIDRAKLSLSETVCTLNNKIRYAIYDETVRSTLVREKQLEDKMEAALTAGEFEVYFQPKYNTQTEQVGGAEALVRWQDPSEGMIYPDEFIPLFEKNGFVAQIDLFVFEKVCQTLECWAKAGLPLVRISVNCSRVHLKMPNFLEDYRLIVEKYDIPLNMLEIELTESAVFEDSKALSNVIREIHSMGFGCSMDDFGSGYSSLNLIREIPVDTLKLDKIFFKNETANVDRTKSVVGSIISMAKALHMCTVAEGVEKRSHVDMLKTMKCDYVQGYYFAKPMPIAEFEKLTFGSPCKKPPLNEKV
ncbi:MAG: EAL domain-containing protein [Oscillospiraceae bacterium]